ncbi:MAG TPA: flagellar protein FliT [Gammaproteobacteria bacterium]|nr:flagellar protein FliT [Gammaproteobacteria bacterium]
MISTASTAQSCALPRDGQWLSILHLARSMRQEARLGEWQKVMERESERQQILLAFFSKPLSHEESQDIANGIHEILEIDKEIFSLGKQRMKGLSSRLSTIRTGSKAVSIYSSNKP